MTDAIVYVDRSAIRTTDLDRLRQAMHELVDFIQQREPQLISYSFFIDEGASQMTVVAIHPDAASMELHMEVGSPRFPPVRRVHRTPVDRRLWIAEPEGDGTAAAEGSDAG